MSPLAWLNPGRWLLVAAFIAALVLGAWRLDVSRQAIGYDRATAEQAVRDRAAEAEVRKKETKWQQDIDGVAYDAQEKIDALEIELASADAAADRLRAAAKIAASRARTDSGTADASAATSDPIGVLADVLIELDERAGIYAEAADRSRIAGLACEKAYDAVSIESAAMPVSP